MRGVKPRLGHLSSETTGVHDDRSCVRTVTPVRRRRVDWRVHHRLYVHVVWTTRDRAPRLDAKVAGFLWRFLRDVARQERAVVLDLGFVSTHVHLLLRLHPTTSLPRLLQRLKGGSAVIGTRESHAHPDPLRWSKGYGVVSVSPAAVENVRRYVREQHLHHPEQAIPDWPPPEPENRVPAARARMLASEEREGTGP
jgi:REP element-mobilizing transposase RayT